MFRKSLIIRVAERHGFSLSRDCEKLCLHGDYARNIQLVFSKNSMHNGHKMINRVYVGVNLYREKLVMGLLREYTNVRNGTVVNASKSISFSQYNEENIEEMLKKLLQVK